MVKRLAFSIIGAALWVAAPAPAQISYLDNGSLQVGVDLARGGAISYLSPSGSTTSLVNVYDLGRFIQQSYYSGPVPFVPAGSVQHPAYTGWGWNPVQAGDVYGNLPQLVAESNDGTTIYVKSIPRQWALSGVLTDCTLETWVTLDDNRVQVRNSLVNSRSDPTRYAPFHQELPAVYTVGTLYRLFTYTGKAPFTGDGLTQITNSGPPWEYWQSTENWSALVDAADFGLGVYQPGAYLTIGGFHGTPGWGGPNDGNTGYLAPLQSDVLDHDIVYEFEYTLIVGDLNDDIRSYVYARAANRMPGPQLVFRRDRQHTLPANLTDPAPPFDGFWPLVLDQADPNLILPPDQWDAADVPTVTIRAAFRTQDNQAEIFFAGPDGAFTGSQRLSFTIVPDGLARAYVVDLSAHPLYAGTITRLRLDPIVNQTAGDEVDLYAVGTSAVSEVPASRRSAALLNFPNPFNPRTSIRYELAQTAAVELRVFDAAGHQVRVLKAGIVEGAGPHQVTWDGRDDAGLAAASGAYFACLRTGTTTQTTKMLLVR